MTITVNELFAYFVAYSIVLKKLPFMYLLQN